MILSCQNISKSFNEKSILNDVSFHIEDHDKAAIVGINGAGKTTLLRIITGEMTADTGIVTLAKGKSFGYLAQNQNVNSENTIYDELLSVKADVIALEKQLRETEIAMKTADPVRQQFYPVQPQRHRRGLFLQSPLPAVVTPSAAPYFYP